MSYNQFPVYHFPVPSLWISFTWLYIHLCLCQGSSTAEANCLLMGVQYAIIWLNSRASAVSFHQPLTPYQVHVVIWFQQVEDTLLDRYARCCHLYYLLFSFYCLEFATFLAFHPFSCFAGFIELYPHTSATFSESRKRWSTMS